MSSGRKTRPPSSWKREGYEKHRLKVNEATSAIDVTPPKDRPHVLVNAKGAQLERERQARIARENFILLKKLRDIMHRKRAEEESQRLKWQDSRCLRIR